LKFIIIHYRKTCFLWPPLNSITKTKQATEKFYLKLPNCTLVAIFILFFTSD
jgi:hypothetical protein